MDLINHHLHDGSQLQSRTNIPIKQILPGGLEGSDVDTSSDYGMDMESTERPKDEGTPHERRGQEKRPSKVQMRSQSTSDNTANTGSNDERPTISSTRSRTEGKVSRLTRATPALELRKPVPKPSLTPSPKVSVQNSIQLSGERTTRVRSNSTADSAGESDALNSLRDKLRKEREDRRKSDEVKDKAHYEELESLLQHISALKADNQTIEQKYQDALAKSKDYATKIRTLQELAHKQGDSAEWMPDSATDTTLQLEKFASDIRKWSKSWAWCKKDGRPYELDAVKCTRELHPLKDVSVDVLPRRSRGEAFKRTVPLWLLLSAAISNVAFMSLIGDPFFAFKTPNSAGAFSVANGTNLECVFAAIKNSNEAGAETWRCQLIRLLDPVNSNSATAKHNKEVARDARKNAAAGLAHECMTGALKCMIKEPYDKAYEELTSILVRGAELGWSLWAQKMRFEVLGLQSLQQLMQTDRLRFDSESEYLQADRLNSTALDKHQKALDGVPIALVVSPAVVAIGTADGTEYDLRRVWKNATVLIDD